jgi:hypothetical protein
LRVTKAGDPGEPDQSRHESEIEPSRTELGRFIEGVARDCPGLYVVLLPVGILNKDRTGA